MIRFSPLLVALALAACTAAPAPLGDGPSGDLAPRVLPAPPEAAFAAIDSVELRAHIAELASDAFEGRGTGTPGEEKAVGYIIARMRAMGLVGGMPDGSFRQPVPLRSVRTTTAEELAFVPVNGGDPKPLAYGPDLIGVPDGTISQLDLAGAEMVFVGYGITNPGYDWDDYKDADVRGKVVVSFVNDPPATNAEPTLFQADTLTYNGRWTYKYEEARRRGALAMLLIHTDATAGYPFGVLNSDPYSEHYSGVEPPEGALALAGWISRGRRPQPRPDVWDVARRLVPPGGQPLVPARRAPRHLRGVDGIRARRWRDRHERRRQAARADEGRRGRGVHRAPRPPRHRPREGGRAARTASTTAPSTTPLAWRCCWRSPRRSPPRPSRRCGASTS